MCVWCVVLCLPFYILRLLYCSNRVREREREIQRKEDPRHNSRSEECSLSLFLHPPQLSHPIQRYSSLPFLSLVLKLHPFYSQSGCCCPTSRQFFLERDIVWLCSSYFAVYFLSFLLLVFMSWCCSFLFSPLVLWSLSSHSLTAPFFSFVLHASFMSRTGTRQRNNWHIYSTATRETSRKQEIQCL